MTNLSAAPGESVAQQHQSVSDLKICMEGFPSEYPAPGYLVPRVTS